MVTIHPKKLSRRFHNPMDSLTHMRRCGEVGEGVGPAEEGPLQMRLGPRTPKPTHRRP